ncbi:MAG: hypothetical protein CNLJKLNK_00906 [Holosporales bacterium]
MHILYPVQDCLKIIQCHWVSTQLIEGRLLLPKGATTLL